MIPPPNVFKNKISIEGYQICLKLYSKIQCNNIQGEEIWCPGFIIRKIENPNICDTENSVDWK